MAWESGILWPIICHLPWIKLVLLGTMGCWQGQLCDVFCADATACPSHQHLNASRFSGSPKMGDHCWLIILDYSTPQDDGYMDVWEVKMLFVCFDVFKHYTESSSCEDVKMLGHKWHAIRHPDQLVDKAIFGVSWIQQQFDSFSIWKFLWGWELEPWLKFYSNDSQLNMGLWTLWIHRVCF